MKTATLAAVGLAGVLALTGCTSAATPSAPASETPGGAPSGMPQAPSGGNRMPGVFGLIADVDGSTLQVQGNDGQTAVTFSDTTTITQDVAADASALAVGACVTVRGTTTDDVTAAETVSISQASADECTGFGGFDGGQGGRPGGNGGGDGRTPPADLPAGGRPSGMPSDGPGGAGMPSARPGGSRPSGGAGGPGGGFDRGSNPTTGIVTAISDGKATISVQRPSGGAGGSSAGGTSGAGEASGSGGVGGGGGSGAGESSEATFTFASAKFTVTAAAAADSLAVGRCVRAMGETSKTGAVTASTIHVSDAVDGACGIG